MPITASQYFRENRDHLPDWLYNALPYLYFSVGLSTMVMVGTGMAAFSGLTLMLAGATVGMMRYRFRRAFKQNYWLRDILEERAQPEAADAGLVYVAWRTAYESGHPVIDEQHRQLFALDNELINALLCRKPKAHVESLLNQLVDDVANHFCAEEAILARTRHALSQEHQDIHRSLLAKAKNLRDRYHNDEVDIRELVGFVVYDVVTKHIVREDIKFSLGAK